MNKTYVLVRTIQTATFRMKTVYVRLFKDDRGSFDSHT